MQRGCFGLRRRRASGFGFFGNEKSHAAESAALQPQYRRYYQRMVLDTPRRNGLRALSALICLFGGNIFTVDIGATLNLPVFLEVVMIPHKIGVDLPKQALYCRTFSQKQVLLPSTMELSK